MWYACDSLCASNLSNESRNDTKQWLASRDASYQFLVQKISGSINFPLNLGIIGNTVGIISQCEPKIHSFQSSFKTRDQGQWCLHAVEGLFGDSFPRTQLALPNLHIELLSFWSVQFSLFVRKYCNQWYSPLYLLPCWLYPRVDPWMAWPNPSRRVSCAWDAATMYHCIKSSTECDRYKQSTMLDCSEHFTNSSGKSCFTPKM